MVQIIKSEEQDVKSWLDILQVYIRVYQKNPTSCNKMVQIILHVDKLK